MIQLNSLLISRVLTPRQIQAQEAYLQRLEENPFDALLEEPNYLELLFQKVENLVQYGITEQEFQNLLVLLLVLRFIIYSIYYNPITSFKMCCIGGFSAYLWLTTFFNHTNRYFPYMANNVFMANMYDEQLQDFMSVIKESTHKGMMDSVALSSDPSNYSFWSVMRFRILARELVFGSLIPFVQQLWGLIPQSFFDTIRPITDYFGYNILPLVQRFWKLNAQGTYGMIAYTFIVRVQKKYCPYHIRWHYTYVLIHSFVSRNIYTTLQRAQLYVLNVLIPQRRFEEAETISIYIGVAIWLHLSCIMLATLHALFSQYFFVPLLTEAVELHIGPRPKRSIWSGGYTAWQDQPTFYKREFNPFGDSTRLWWGWLGRGLNFVPPPPKKDRRGYKKAWRKIKRTLKEVRDYYLEPGPGSLRRKRPNRAKRAWRKIKRAWRNLWQR